MKRALLVASVAGLAVATFAQTSKVVRLPYPEVVSGVAKTGERTLTVWLPKNYSKSNKYPTIYTFTSGAGELIAQMAAYYEDRLHQIPPVIVVGLEVGTEDMGYTYETAGVNASGDAFAKFVSGTVMPYVDKTYATAPFRTYFGHSYGATYTDYLLTVHPDWFHGYALLAPEQPHYKLDYQPLLAKLPSPFYYFVADAKLDVERRQIQANDIAKQLDSPAAKSIHFKHDTLPQADHLTSIPQGVGAALEFLFSGYKDFDYHDSDGDVSKWFEALEKRTEDLYGFGILADSNNAYIFTNLAAEKKDLKALGVFEKFFLNDQSNASQFFNTAQIYYNLGDYAHAEPLYRRSIERSKRTNQLDFRLMSYRTLGLRLYSEQEHNPEKAWSVLEQGMKDTYDVAYKFFLGTIAARHGYRVDDGIRYLTEFEKERSQSFFGSLYKVDVVYVLLAKCYLAKGDKATAKTYVEKSLALNPDNEDAKALKTQL